MLFKVLKKQRRKAKGYFLFSLHVSILFALLRAFFEAGSMWIALILNNENNGTIKPKCQEKRKGEK